LGLPHILHLEIRLTTSDSPPYNVTCHHRVYLLSSLSTIIFTRPLKVTVGFHPSFALALVDSAQR